MKKTYRILSAVTAAALSTSLAAAVYADRNGDIVGSVLYTDIVAYIDGQPIRSYNIGGYTAVVVEDLEQYGFDVVWDGDARRITAIRDMTEEIQSQYQQEENTHKNGSFAAPVYSTDIIADFDGIEITSYNIGGRTIVYLDEIAKLYGSSYCWNETERTLSLFYESEDNNTNETVIEDKDDYSGQATDSEEEDSVSIEITENPEYDNSINYQSYILQDGDMILGGTYTATETDESVIEASGNVSACVKGAILKKPSGDASSANDSSFKGVNSGVRVYGNAVLTIDDCIIETDAKNATGVFAYENGFINISDCVIDVTGGGAGGVQVAGGGTLYGSNLTVTSASKAAIRSDKGGGIIVIDGGTYTSTGKDGCPAIYSTADITVRNSECISLNSRAVIIEGKNSVTLENCNISGNDQSKKNESVHADILLYQSTSGDAEEGTSVFSMTGGSIISNSGAVFYCTNTNSVINLDHTNLSLSDDGTLLIVSAGRWGRNGKNGGNCIFNADSQMLIGDVIVDSISSLDLNLTGNSLLRGSIDGNGEVNVRIEQGSKWILTGDSMVTDLTGDLSGIELNGYKLIVNGEEYEG